MARLLLPKIVKMKRERGRPVSNATKLKADRIAELYFFERARRPRAKHKEEVAPFVARYYGVSIRYVDTVLAKLDPVRRAELKSYAASVAELWAEWEATPAGIKAMTELAEAKRKLRAAKQSGSYILKKHS
jgi:hypothetical protein